MRPTTLLAALSLAAAPAGTFAQGTTPPPAAPRPAAPAAPAAFGGGDRLVDRIVAVVGTEPITLSQLYTAVNERRAQGMTIPTDSAGQAALARDVLNELIDEEVLVQKARETKVEVTDEEVNSTVDNQMKQVRARFRSDAEFRTALREAGRGSPEELRREYVDQARRSLLARKYVQKMREENKLVPGVVSEEEVRRYFEARRATAGKRPATAGFRQIVVAPTPSKAARDRALAKAESLLVEVRKNGNFELVAKRESMDPGSKELGGDLGWNRRGTMVPEFDRVMFAMNPGQISPVIETGFGFHIIKVDRVQPAEVKARHILIRPAIDSADVAAARVRADSVYEAWKRGAKFEELAAKYNDRRRQEQPVIPEVNQDQLPASYAAAITGHAQGDLLKPFPIEDRANGTTKFVVAQITLLNPGGEYQLSDVRGQIRDQLAQEKGMRRMLQSLRESVYVSIRL